MHSYLNCFSFSSLRRAKLGGDLLQNEPVAGAFTFEVSQLPGNTRQERSLAKADDLLKGRGQRQISAVKVTGTRNEVTVRWSAPMNEEALDPFGTLIRWCDLHKETGVEIPEVVETGYEFGTPLSVLKRNDVASALGRNDEGINQRGLMINQASTCSFPTMTSRRRRSRPCYRTCH